MFEFVPDLSAEPSGFPLPFYFKAGAMLGLAMCFESIPLYPHLWTFSFGALYLEIFPHVLGPTESTSLSLIKIVSSRKEIFEVSVPSRTPFLCTFFLFYTPSFPPSGPVLLCLEDAIF